MKICWRGLHRLQLVHAQGEVRVCGWIKDDRVGNILENDIPEIMHGEKMREIASSLAAGDYSICDKHACPYLSNDKMDEMLIDADGIPDYPEHLSLSYENNCNYHCSGCFSHARIAETKCHDYTENYDRIEERLIPVLPHIKHIAAHGTGELFASPRTLKLLGSWRPLAPAEECRASLETNGSLFTPENWKKIENLGQYHLSVTITVMSFQEDIYQLLSGTKLPISVIENNLKFVRSLREQGVINRLSLGSVMQEANFREMPSFIQRCLEEYAADHVHIRQIRPGGPYDQNIQWFFDVRNPAHPYYELYQKVIDHPIFRDPRVRMDSGYLPSERGEHPGVRLEKELGRCQAIQRAMSKLLDDPELLLPHLPGGAFAVFGLGPVAKLVASQYRERVCRIYATTPKTGSFNGIPVTALREAAFHGVPAAVLVTPYNEGGMVSERLREIFGDGLKIINLWDIV